MSSDHKHVVRTGTSVLTRKPNSVIVKQNGHRWPAKQSQTRTPKDSNWMFDVQVRQPFPLLAPRRWK